MARPFKALKSFIQSVFSKYENQSRSSRKNDVITRTDYIKCNQSAAATYTIHKSRSIVRICLILSLEATFTLTGQPIKSYTFVLHAANI